MKNRGIVIELTALLDVILIMLFWVMMSINGKNDEVRAEAESKVSEYQQQYEEIEDELEDTRQELEDTRESIKELDSEAYANQEALYGYEEGMLVTLNLKYDAVGKLFILDNSRELGHTLLGSDKEISGSIIASLEKAGFEKDDVILCAFVYDGDRALYHDINTVEAAVEIVGGEYRNFYCTYINTSR